ncbi:Dam family site-specific DNA-(adenine-N6)-methyltransferase [Synechococcus sp. RSCCF101]|uniref:DNA adenine methylase n=1 Tax=Synechococcus sp. RSCCF101 TaxID=2511069 RepID=UPI001243A97B|nr:Dam family site-specific DNA-(adenine-N6)-methyltransferase [Synechococcus sp. RSCCF101]QEY31250.1 Dam family site-specific DNA-(adenine-N6)-methyltransferase [Synechococcus sp. RSCCF101]
MSRAQPRPIVKWAGGKQAIAHSIVSCFPSISGTYYEPFLGGASVFMRLRPARAVLNDSNSWLIDTYIAVRENWRAVAAILHELPNTRADYLRIRLESRTCTSPWRRAAYFVYLNKTCFRGLYRVNRQNHFNVPYGAYNRRYFDENNLALVSDSLRSAQLRSTDFECSLAGARPGDVVYFDPPYYKLGGYSDFNRYTSAQFREPDHERLAALCRKLDAMNIRWFVSNSDTDYVRRLFAGYSIRSIANRRDINLVSRRRGVRELLISNDRLDDDG